MREALAHDSVPSPLKPYAENQHPYHPFTGTGCTGLTNDNDLVLEDHRAQPAADPLSSACNSATPNRNDSLEDSSILLQTICMRGKASRAFQEAQALNVGTRILPQAPTTTIPPSDEEAFQDAEEDNL